MLSIPNSSRVPKNGKIHAKKKFGRNVQIIVLKYLYRNNLNVIDFFFNKAEMFSDKI